MMDLAVSNDAINGHTAPAERQLRLVAPGELATYWPLIKSGVERVHALSSDGWLPEDLYMALKQGTAALYVGFVANYYTGFIVLRPEIGWAGPQAHIWALYSRGERDTLETFLPDLLEIVRNAGITRLTMASPRKGWERRAEQLGFHYLNTHFALEV